MYLHSLVEEVCACVCVCICTHVRICVWVHVHACVCVCVCVCCVYLGMAVYTYNTSSDVIKRFGKFGWCNCMSLENFRLYQVCTCVHPPNKNIECITIKLTGSNRCKLIKYSWIKLLSKVRMAIWYGGYEITPPGKVKASHCKQLMLFTMGRLNIKTAGKCAPLLRHADLDVIEK